MITEEMRQKKLKELKEKLTKLYGEHGEDANYSLRDAASSLASIDILKKEIAHYEELVVDSSYNEVVLTPVEKGEQKEQVIFKIVDNMPDPAKNILSSSSEVGQKLKKSKKGDVLKIGDQKYKVVSRSLKTIA